MPKQSLVIVSRPTKVEEVKDVAVVKTKTQKGRSRRRRRGGRRSSGRRSLLSSGGMPLTKKYLRSLIDPFENPGLSLGWGCLQPTRLAQAYLRTALTANADGSFSVVAVPNAKKLLYSNNAGSNTATWTTSDALDLAAINANAGLGRTVSIGIRAFPDIASTAVPGACSVGALPGQTHDTLITLTPSDLFNLPTSHIYRGYEGGSSTGRPMDATSFEFYGATVDSVGFAGGNIIPFSLPYVSFVGLPASALVYVEVCLNIEYLPEISHGIAPLGVDDVPAGETLADEQPILERFWSSIRNSIPTPGQMGEAAASAWNLANSEPVKGAASAFLRTRGRTPQSATPYMGLLQDLADRFYGR